MEIFRKFRHLNYIKPATSCISVNNENRSSFRLERRHDLNSSTVWLQHNRDRVDCVSFIILQLVFYCRSGTLCDITWYNFLIVKDNINNILSSQGREFMALCTMIRLPY